MNKQQYLNIQESADDEVISTEVGKSGSKYMDEGEGLDAMAAAASLRCVFPNSRSNNRPSARSSLADLLDAATFR